MKIALIRLNLFSAASFYSANPLRSLMKLSKPQRLILFALGQFYTSLNQPLVEKPLQVRTSKIAFIEHVIASAILSEQERSLYKNLETLQINQLISYQNKMIMFTESGIKEMEKTKKEIQQFIKLEQYFQQKKPKGKLQTVIRN